jgi:AbiTii-like protein
MAGSTSIVLELQRLASDSTAPIGDLLRKAMIVATKLKIEDFRLWIQDELDGYDKPVPEYRMVRGRMSAVSRFGKMPMQFGHPEIEVDACTAQIMAGVAEIEQLSHNPELLHVTLPGHKVRLIQQYFGDQQFLPDLEISPAAMRGILDTVRNTVLNWALRLEAQGILGDGMTFSEEEKKKASDAPNIHIGNIGSFQGNLGGNLTAHDLQIGSFSTINDQLKDAGISQQERNELENILDQMKTKTADKSSLVQRGLRWIDKNKLALGTLAVDIAKIFHDQQK